MIIIDYYYLALYMFEKNNKMWITIGDDHSKNIAKIDKTPDTVFA